MKLVDAASSVTTTNCKWSDEWNATTITGACNSMLINPFRNIRIHDIDLSPFLSL